MLPNNVLRWCYLDKHLDCPLGKYNCGMCRYYIDDECKFHTNQNDEVDEFTDSI